MRIAGLFAAVLIGFAISACMTYRYGDRSFDDRKEAEAAQKADRDLIRGAFKPRSTTLAKTGRIVIPTKTLILERGLRKGGPAEGRDYVAISLYNGYRLVGETIKRRNIFDRTDIEETAEAGHAAPKSGEAVIYLFMPDNKTAGWYYVSEATKRTPLHFDDGNPDRVGRVKYFIDSIEVLAASETR